MQDRNCKADRILRAKGKREREREKGGRGGGDAIFTPIYGEIPGRGTLTTSKQDLWKTPGDLRYHYLPRSGTVFRWTLMPAWFYSISFHRKKMLPLTHLTIHDPRVASSFIAINVSSVSCFSSVGLVLLLDWKERRKMGFSSLLFFSLCRGREFTGGEIWGSLWVTIYLFVFIVEETRCGTDLIVLLSLLFSRCSSNVIKFGV